MIAKFTENLVQETAVVSRAEDRNQVLKMLTEIVVTEGLTAIFASTDEVIAPLELHTWGKENSIDVFTAEDFENRMDYKQAVFERVDAGITGPDFAVAESGTLIHLHDKEQPRLVSLAPLTHIAVVRAERLYRTYEEVFDMIADTGNAPSHITLTTGPSMTADIQGVPFKGMHGPKKLFVIILG
jgi:L-lactate dehydrogenase complex protein LldG